MSSLHQTAVCTLVFGLLWVGIAGAQDSAPTPDRSEASNPPGSLETRDIVFASAREGPDAEIWRMGPDGSNPRRLTQNEGVNDNFPVWSPDGSQIVFLSDRDTTSQGRSVFVMEADGSNVRAVGPSKWPIMSTPEWSPDGSKILFSAGSSLYDLDLYVMDADGSDVRQLTSGPTADRCASWGPEGRRILYALESENGDTSRVMIRDLTSGDTRNALPDGMEGACAYWSPDGDHIAFFSGPDGQLRSLKSLRTEGPGVMEIYMLDLQTGSVTQVTDAGAISNYPRWSPDGQRLVFESTRAFDESFLEDGEPHLDEGGGAWEYFDVYTMDPDGSDVRRITENEHFDAHPNW